MNSERSGQICIGSRSLWRSSKPLVLLLIQPDWLAHCDDNMTGFHMRNLSRQGA